MLQSRLKALRIFDRKPIPKYPTSMASLDNIKYFVRSTEKLAASWDDLARGHPQHLRPVGNPGGREEISS